MNNTRINKKISERKGFTLMEMLIVVAIIAVIIAIAIPTFITLLERSRETSDLANVRSKYSEIVAYAISDETPSAESGIEVTTTAEGKQYKAEIILTQSKNEWQTAEGNRVVADVRYGDENWKNEPQAHGTCTILFVADRVTIDWGGDPIVVSTPSLDSYVTFSIMNSINDALLAADFKGNKVSQRVVNSGETFAGGGTQRLLENLPENFFEDLGIGSWKLFLSSTYSGKSTGNYSINSNAIYWTTLDLDTEIANHQSGGTLANNEKSSFTIPIIGYNQSTNSYDVAKIAIRGCNNKEDGSYYSLGDISVESATYQYESYEDALAAYNYLLDMYNDNFTNFNKTSADTVLTKAGLMKNNGQNPEGKTP